MNNHKDELVSKQDTIQIRFRYFRIMRMSPEYLHVFTICGFLIGLSVSFSTNICSHDDLVQKTKESFQCDREFHARIFQNARENVGNDGFCEIMKERWVSMFSTVFCISPFIYIIYASIYAMNSHIWNF